MKELSRQNFSPQTDLEVGGFKGTVKQVKQDTFIALEEFGEIVLGKKGDGFQRTQLTNYNTMGNRIDINTYVSNGNLYDKHIFKYDDKGNCVERNLCNSDGSLDEKHIFKYDDKGNRVEMYLYNSDGTLDIYIIYKYDELGNIRMFVHKSLNGKLNGGNFSLIEEIVCTYDGDRNMIEEIVYDSNGNYLGNSYYSNYNIGRSYDPNNLNFKPKYDDKGHMIEETGYNKYQMNDEDEYNTLNDEDEYNPYYIITDIFKNKYDYDQQGNWIKKIEFKNDVPKYITLREIEYY